MALFDFLAPAQTALNLAGAGASVANLFGMGRNRATEKAVRAQAERAVQLSEALTNPNSPLFQQMSADALQQQRTARLQGISDFVREQERQARRFPSSSGNVSLFARNPRRDEAIARAMMMAGQNEQAEANQQARQTLAQGLGALGASTQALGIAGRAQAQNQLMRQVGVPSGLFGASRFLGEAAKTLGGGQPPYTPTQNPFVNYATPNVEYARPTERQSGLLYGGV